MSRNTPFRLVQVRGGNAKTLLLPRDPSTARRPSMSLRPSAIDRAADTGLDALGFSLNLSIKY